VAFSAIGDPIDVEKDYMKPYGGMVREKQLVLLSKAALPIKKSDISADHQELKNCIIIEKSHASMTGMT